MKSNEEYFFPADCTVAAAAAKASFQIESAGLSSTLTSFSSDTADVQSTRVRVRDVERILDDAGAHLTEDGVLICEIGGSDDEFEARFPGIPVAWPEFERGGDGVFVIGRDELNDWQRARRRRK